MSNQVGKHANGISTTVHIKVQRQIELIPVEKLRMGENDMESDVGRMDGGGIQ